MAKVTGKFQITLPKRLADTYGIKIGDEVDLLAAGDRIAIVPPRAASAVVTTAERLKYFDEATRRQRARERADPLPAAKSRGWTREDLYIRGRSR